VTARDWFLILVGVGAGGIAWALPWWTSGYRRGRRDGSTYAFDMELRREAERRARDRRPS
jgi:hypothetical protein